MRILLIDDDEQIRFALSAVCDSQGWTPVSAEDALIGLRLFESEGADIVLIDYHLPKMNGIEGVRRLRALSATVPIIVFTIDDDQSVADEFLKAGASDFALKPIKAPDMISRIRLHIRLMQSESRAGSEEPQVKGISGATLTLIEETMQDMKNPETVRAIANSTGLAYQTTYRYLQYLLAEGRVAVENVYGKVGRPKQLYRYCEEERRG